MFKKIILVVFLIVVVIGIDYWISQSQKEVGQPTETQTFTLDPKNCTYTIEGKSIILTDGYSEEEIAPGSASKIITRYFGNEVSGDFNGDGLSDIAFLLTQNSGGSGTFYYTAVALAGDNKCNGINAILLGDRIAPQTTNFMNGEIIVNYADRKPDEPMTASPSIGVSKYLKITEGQLAEINKEKTIKGLLADKYGKDISEVTITIEQETENHAKGIVVFQPGGSENSGMFLAAKVNGEWQLLHDGQGAYSCSMVEPYNFPPEMIQDCY